MPRIFPWLPCGVGPIPNKDFDVAESYSPCDHLRKPRVFVQSLFSFSHASLTAPTVNMWRRSRGAVCLSSLHGTFRGWFPVVVRLIGHGSIHSADPILKNMENAWNIWSER